MIKKQISPLPALSWMPTWFSHFAGVTRPVLYDIETTGFSPRTGSVYLIGAVAPAENGLCLYQWFAETPAMEEEILHSFAEFLKGKDGTIQFNGDLFDMPFLTERARQYDIRLGLENLPSLDVYKELKPFKNLLGLSGMKQPQLEHWLGFTPRQAVDGGACIKLYASQLRAPDPRIRQTLCLHNEEDLTGLGRILPLLSFVQLEKGGYRIASCRILEEAVIFTLAPAFPFPGNVHFSWNDFSFCTEHGAATVSFRLHQNRTKIYHREYRKYAFLPSEDQAIPRQLARFLERGKTVPAQRETCYTWYTVPEGFDKDPAAQSLFLEQNLPPCLEIISHLRPAVRQPAPF